MAERRLRLFRRKARTKAAGEAIATPALMQVLAGLDGSAAGYGTVYRKVTPVRTVIDYLADAIASTPLKVYRRAPNGRPEAFDHPLAVLLRNPNPDLSAYDLIWRLAADLAIYANHYWLMGARGGKPQITPLPPFRVTPRGGDLLRAATYDFFSQTGLPPASYSASEIIHFRLYDPEDPRIGSSKLEALRTTVLEEVEASKYRLGLWKNNAKIGGVLTHPEHLSSEAVTRLQTSFDNTYAGPENSGKTAVLEEGARWTPTASTARESEFIEGREFVLEATARAYNIPLALLGLSQTATYASMREAHKQLYMDVLPPWYERIQAAIELQLLPFFGDQNVYVEFVVDGKLRGDFIDRIDVLNKAIGRPHMTVREGRKLENLDDRHVPEDDELVIPVGPNFALEGMAVAAPASPPALAPVTALPTAQTAASQLSAFFARQERSVIPRLAAGHEKAFDRERWDRELAALVGPERAAEINLRTQVLLITGSDPREVFAELKQVQVA
jgi:HK97 family phage portal protein